MRQATILNLAILGCLLLPHALLAHAQAPDPERPVCRRDGSARVSCLPAWSERMPGERLRHALGGKRIVTFYGSPLGRGLGILGNSPPETMLTQLRAQTAVYVQLDPDTEIVPAFHMVTTVADAFPGDDGDYNHRVSHEVIRQWIDWAAEENAWVILDIQPGRADTLAEVELIEPFLHASHVQLAVDPEFIVGADGVPGQRLGSIDAETINRVQERLDRIARSIGMTKVLIIHQFDDRMIVDKEAIRNYWTVEMVWDADGFGGSGAKIHDYKQYRNETGFEKGGFKIFYEHDVPVLTPQEVMALVPIPSIIIYQ